uniref:LiaF transmembrane domain-containing protein n=1 Tax=uncultured Draconibacterium sp. TaxID=1573823 RepID=UPI0032170809
MEKVPQKENTRETLALVLIGIGLLWILKQMGIFHHISFFHFDNIFRPFHNVLHNVGNIFFSWPMILIIIGIVLLAGKRSGGLVLLIIGGIFILPKLLIISGVSIILLFPLLLIAIGIALVAKII